MTKIWLPCVIRYLETTWPKFLSYHQIISNATLGGPSLNLQLSDSRVCPSKVSFSLSLKSDPRFEKTKVTWYGIGGQQKHEKETLWRLKR